MPSVQRVKTVKAKSDVQKVRSARTVATQAIKRAAEVAVDLKKNRSSRTRESYKIKADALDRVGRILGGKE